KEEKAAAKGKEDDPNLADLKEQIAAMQRKLDAMS
ncbi:MAG: polyhydroxyalkanoate synthesis repressor PhaR, partial [Brucellaceae bacterium]|nr:polyhydroxyalkanoate synthesis repressor PhaR [Brucellaceae bacterium]